MSTRPAKVEVGQVYRAWGKRWRVTRVWHREGVAEAVNVANPANTIRNPLSSFREMEQAS